MSYKGLSSDVSADISVDSRSHMGSYIGRVLVVSRSRVSRYRSIYRQPCRTTVDRGRSVSVIRRRNFFKRPTIDRLSTDGVQQPTLVRDSILRDSTNVLSTDIATDMSTDSRPRCRLLHRSAILLSRRNINGKSSKTVTVQQWGTYETTTSTETATSKSNSFS